MWESFYKDCFSFIYKTEKKKKKKKKKILS
jgi:hypothetical protein